VDFKQLKAQADREWKKLEQNDRPVIFIGMATCGRAAGAEEVREELRRLALDAEVVEVGCIGACYAEPLVYIKQPGRPAIVYGDMDPDRTRQVIAGCLQNNDPMIEYALGTIGEGAVAGLPNFFDLPMLKPQVRVVLQNCGLIDPGNINHYIARGGYAGLRRALGMSPEAVIEEIALSGLRGRGGAGFPTGQKWKFCRQSPGDEKYLICNADEGDPGAFMDRSVIEGDPHAVLEGMCIAAYAIGANHGYVYIRAEYPLAIMQLKAAMKQMEELGFIGKNIMGSGLSFEIKIKEGAGAFVCGEETALMASIEGERGMPRPRPPFPAVKGLFGKPTNINNVETLANVARILEKGGKWYAGFGTEKSRGTKTFALAGKIVRTGLIEVPMGIKLRDVIYEVGGGIVNGKKFKAVQTGGPSGGCIPAQFLDMPVDYENLARVGSIVGSGGMVVLDEDNCMVDLARYFLTFTKSESCGKCTPCRLGTTALLDILERIVQGRGTPEDLPLLEELGAAVKAGSLCGLGQTAPNPVLTTLQYFREEYEEHILDKKCRAVSCREIVGAPCRHTCPAGVDAARYLRLIQAGRPEEALRVIYERIPFPSVCGSVCFHPCETHCRRGLLDEAVSVRALKRFATEAGGQVDLSQGAAKPRGKKVAVVGAGPAGLTAAYYLAKKGGRQVTIFESLPQAGGMLRYGIPDYRLPRKILDAEIAAILAVPGIELKLNAKVNSVLDLLAQGYDAVFISVGAHQGVKIAIPGEEGPGVEDCVSFLRRVKLGAKIKLGRRVAVVGGGNAAVDAARVALREGAEEVKILYRRTRAEMPAYPEEVREAEEEGVQIEFLTVPVKIERSGRKLTVTNQRLRLGPVDKSGRPRPVPMEGSEYREQYDYLIVAIGQEPEVEATCPGIEKTKTIKVNPRTLATSVPGVFAGGDAVSGPASVIEAIAHGRQAAISIDRVLGGTGQIEEVFADPGFDRFPPMPEEAEERRRPTMKYASPQSRIKDYRRIEKGYDPAQAMGEASRCLRCDLEAAAGKKR
jgi:NADH-quinone oxidoreductase subunit F